MASILSKLRTNSKSKYSAILTDSPIFNDKDIIPIAIPILNVALSGKLDGGLTPGLTMWAGPSRHFKSLFSLLMAKAYMDKYPDASLIFFDSEFGTPLSYFNSLGIDTDRVLHEPFTNIEELKHSLMNHLEVIERNDRVIMIVDSIGNSASKKEVDDAVEGKSVTDMTRAKALKSLFRMVTPHLTIKNIPLVVVNHTYETMEMFSKQVVGGGTGGIYSSDNIFIIGRRQEKDGDDLAGYSFIINVEKSRYVKEKSKIPVKVTFEGGISKFSGIFDLAVEGGWVVPSDKKGRYNILLSKETGELDMVGLTEKKIEASPDILAKIIADPLFREYVEHTYALSEIQMVQDMEAEIV